MRAARWIAAAVAAVLLAGCSASATTPTAPPNPSNSATLSANAQTCQDFRKQVTWVRAHRATMTLTDAATVFAWIGMDAGNSTGRLHRDFKTLSAVMQRGMTGANVDDRAQINRVESDCGITR